MTETERKTEQADTESRSVQANDEPNSGQKTAAAEATPDVAAHPAEPTTPQSSGRKQKRPIPWKGMLEVATLVVLIAGVVVPSWVAWYVASEEHNIAAQNLDIAKQQLAQQKANAPRIVRDATDRVYLEIDGQLLPLATNGGPTVTPWPPTSLNSGANHVGVANVWNRVFHSGWPFVIGGVVTASLLVASWLFLRARFAGT